MAPYLLIAQIPCHDGASSSKDADFSQQLARYTCCTSHPGYRCFTAYKQDDQSYPRWLIIQGFDTLDEPEHLPYVTMKEEAKRWWLEQGREGVELELFKRLDAYGEQDGEDKVAKG